MNRDYNPFANLDLHIPMAYREEVRRFSTDKSGESDNSPELSPFIRYVDLWTAAVAIGAQEGHFTSVGEKHRFITGSVLQGDLARIEFLQLLAIGHTNDPYVVKDSRQVLDIAESYAAGGLPILLDWMAPGSSSPMVTLTKNLIKFLNESTPATAEA